MKPLSKLEVTAVATALIAFAWIPAPPAQQSLLRQADWLIEELQLDAAAQAVEEFELANPDDPGSLYLRSRLLFYEGDFGAALEYADLACQAELDGQGPLCAHRDLVAATADAVEGFREYHTSLGHFIIWYDPQRDEVLIPYADETLERAYAEIGFDFGYWPIEPVNVHIYPNARTLAGVSTLTEEAIETSGTVALCKFNRLMITSPRALVHGYGWRDTLSHEYVHLIIQHLTGTRVPIWLHEGLAKYEERRWRGYRARMLPPSSQDLLARRLEEDDLITFDEMHPSMAFLPSQQDASTAFAEVYTVVEYLHANHGIEGIRELIWSIGEGRGIEEAFQQVTALPFQEYLARWEEYMRRRTYQRLPGDYVPALQFMPQDAADAPPDELAGIAQEEARDYLHLGQLLRARGRIEASILEYRKAESLVGRNNPVFQNWLARALLDLDRPQEAVDALGEAAAYYPEYYRTFLHLGEAELDTNQVEPALDHLLEAVGVNPFDPEVHRQLSRAYQAQGDTRRAEESMQRARMTLRQETRNP